MSNSDRLDGDRFSRRDILALGGAIAAAAALRPAAAAGPVMTRPIPRTGERLPVVGLGTAIVFDIGEDAVRRAERSLVIAALTENGGRVIDTAPSYGAAESVVGDLVAALGARDRVFLATKVRVAQREAAVAEMQASQRRLRSSRIDLMQIHNLGADPAASADQLALLREWKQQGVLRYVGVTHSQATANERLIAHMEREKPDFVQVNYSMAERSVERRLLAVAAETGAAVLINLPFARGKLFAAVRGKPLPEWAAEFEAASWAQFFLKYVLAHASVTCVIPGTDKPEYMLDNLNAGRGRLPDAAMRKRMTEFLDSLR
jgi:aryl-alcohol dehydrogenase-like predicted oxidoreductase